MAVIGGADGVQGGWPDDAAPVDAGPVDVVDEDVVLPTQDDPLLHAGADAVGGVAGWRVRPYSGWWTAMRVCLALAVVAMSFAWLAKQPCREDAWTEGDQYRHACYSDVAILYSARGLSTGGFPYVDDGGTGTVFEYPVLTGLVAGVTAEVVDIVAPDADAQQRTRAYFDLNAWLLAACLCVVVALTCATAGRRPWDGALVALAPGIVLAGLVNWDLWAVACMSAAMWAWARRQPVAAGVFLGLGVAFKLYPLLLLGPLLVLCLRSGRMREWTSIAAAAALTWAAVNIPFIVSAQDAWWEFYRLSEDRGAGFGSPWYALGRHGFEIPLDRLNTVGTLSFGLLCAGVAALAWFAPRRPRVPQLVLLVVMAFVLTNKVYSPQYVVWLVPLVVLARPRWRDLLLWQAAEVLYFFAAWWHLEGIVDPALKIPDWPHTTATVLRMAAQLWICWLVVRDVLRPELDPVRADDLDDDPAGGVLDGAPDVRGPHAVPSPARGAHAAPA